MTMASSGEDDLRRLQEHALRVDAELARRIADDPWWQWSPHPKQEEFIRSVLQGDNDETWAFCANRSGKTDGGAWLGAGFARFGLENPRYQITFGGALVVEDYHTSGCVISLDYGNSRDVVQPKIFDNRFGRDPSHEPFIPAREIADWSITNQILKLKNDNLVAFRSCDAGAIKMAGRGYDWIMFDEPPPKNVYEESVIRVGGSRKTQIFGACTLLPPEGNVGGISWMFEEKVKPWLRGDTPGVAIHTMSIYDNPHILRTEIERLERLYSEGSLSRRIRLDGELLPGLAGNRAYTSFDHRIHVVTQSQEFARRRPIVWFMDFNVEPLCSGLGQYIDGVFHVKKEIILDTDGSIAGMVEALHEILPVPQYEIWIYGDASGRGRHASTGMSEYRLLLQAMRTFGVPVRLKVPEANPPVNDRVNAVNNALVDITNGTSHMEIDPGCRELIADLEGVLRDKNMGIKKTSNRRDPYFRRTHISDALGYWIAHEQPVLLRNFERAEQQEKVKVSVPGYRFGRR